MKTDVCLITEGTYPYVYGGVSSWIHNLVTSLKDVRFSLVNISSTGDTLRTAKYEIPPNILEFKEVFVHDFNPSGHRNGGNQKQAWRSLRNFYGDLERHEYAAFPEIYRTLIDRQSRVLSVRDIFNSKTSWNLLTEYFSRSGRSSSFVDYYWTMRFIHAPILKLFDAELPDAKLYHALCTGYAGLLAVIAKFRKDAPFLLTEHGIYTHERKIEISKARWIYSPEEKVYRARASMGYLKDLWIKKFDALSRLAYHYADQIVTLFEGNRRMQMEGGADPGKIDIIPNGTAVVAKAASGREGPHTNPVIGFVGRIVPIKDVKTFIRSVKILTDKVPGLKAYILGATDEDEKYYEECRVLVEMLDLQKVVTFTGNVNVDEYYPKMDAVVLTSLSEGQPLSVLEAMSYGLPVVASDVGGCRELLFGGSEEDQALGAAGKITEVGNPHETAGSIQEILADAKTWKRMSHSGVERIKRFYRKEQMIEGYRRIYDSYTLTEASHGRHRV